MDRGAPPAMDPDDRTAADEVFDFVNEYLDDLERGRVRPLTEYLAHYPGREESIAAEFLRLQEEESAPRESEGEGARRRVGHYELEREIGSGGQGSVWLARDTRIARRVALKLLTGGFVTGDRRKRFRREAESIARLEHPGICRIHEADIDADPPYIAMQHVEGLDLASSLALARAGAAHDGGSRDSGGDGGDGALEPPIPWVPRDRAGLSRVLLFFERVAR